jgi:hypothetical protein
MVERRKGEGAHQQVQVGEAADNGVVVDVGSSRSGDVAGGGDRYHQPFLPSPSCAPPGESHRR